MPPLYVFVLDSVLREAHAPHTPIQPMVAFLAAMAATGAAVEIWSTRSEDEREDLEAWMDEHLPPPARPRVHLRLPDGTVGRQFYDQLRAAPRQPSLVFIPQASVTMAAACNRRGVEYCRFYTPSN